MNIKKIMESLSPIEIKIMPYLEEPVTKICQKTNLDKVSVLRALTYLQNKKIVELSDEKKEFVELGTNGALYRKKGLPERRFLNLINEKRIMKLEEIKERSGLSDDEFKVSLGALKKKAMIELNNGRVTLTAEKKEVAKKFLEEQFLESLPIEKNNLTPEQNFAFQSLEKRKDIVNVVEKKRILISVTELGRELLKSEIKQEDLIEQVTSDLIRSGKYKGKKFRRYDVTSSVPEISGGKRHFVNQATDYARKIWTEMGFKEMTGEIIASSFWNFDALFSPQDHPSREMMDTFFINKKSELPEKKIVSAVKQAHESGIAGSKGWQYKWDEDEAKKIVLRTHTTFLSSQTLAKLKKEDLPAKFFAVGKCFRNETIDWKHAFEFNQTEGIVVDENANFRNLLGYLIQFYKKMGYEKIRIRPAYYPFTEPSLEIDVFHPEKKEWVEMGGAGMFRPEVTAPLLGKPIPVLAWGQGLDRMIMNLYKIQDIRDLYKNNLTQIRKMKFWEK